MPDAPDVPAWLDRVRAGDDGAARALVDHLYPLVMKIVRSHRTRRTPEEDLAQEVFLKMFTRLDQYHGRDSVPFDHWVSRIAVTTCLDALRAEKRRPEWRAADLSDGERAWLDFIAQQEAAPAPSDAAASREIVAKLLETLAPEDRLVIQMLDVEQRSVAEICAVTGWGASKVKVRALRARLKLRGHAARIRNEMNS